jgi:Flp pilus assembly protein CpaB
VSPSGPRRGVGFDLGGAPQIALIVVAAAVVILGLMMGLGLLDLSRFRSNERSTAGLVAVPTPARTIAAYTRVRRDHLWDPKGQRLTVVYLPPKAVTSEMIVNLADVIGRVLDHDKTPGYVFTESDFLPKGTREGFVAGIPAGKRAIRIAAERVEGLYGLHSGDRFDLLATMPIDASRSSGLNFSGVYGQQMALQAQLSNWQKQATVRVIVQNGTIVEPMATRGVPTYQSSLTEGGASRVRPVQEAVLAINPEEVALLTEAMAVEAKITTIPRSGRPDDPVDSRTPDLRPVSPFTAPGAGDPDAPNGEAAFNFVETILGQKRALAAVPKQ